MKASEDKSTIDTTVNSHYIVAVTFCGKLYPDVSLGEIKIAAVYNRASSSVQKFSRPRLTDSPVAHLILVDTAPSLDRSKNVELFFLHCWIAAAVC